MTHKQFSWNSICDVIDKVCNKEYVIYNQIILNRIWLKCKINGSYYYLEKSYVAVAHSTRPLLAWCV